MTSGIAGICVGYERDVQEHQKRPANLLDALERGNHDHEEDNVIVGEEKVAYWHNVTDVTE